MSTLKDMTRGNHHKISPTARMMAYFRALSDIPYAKEVSEALGGTEAAKRIYQDDLGILTAFAGPLAEARYKCFDGFIREHSSTLELAVGVAVERGLRISDDPDKVYIGTDLPEIIKDARAFLERIDGSGRTNHHLEVANVLSFEQLDSATSHFGVRENVLVINEGLWGYLTAEERVLCAENVRQILERYGGRWATPDIADLETHEQSISCLGAEVRSAMSRVSKTITTVTGRDVERNCFSTRQQAVRFFHDLGFKVNHQPMADNLRHLTSTAKLWREQEGRCYAQMLTQMTVWVMSLR